MPDRFIREPECRRITGLSRVTRWRLERRGQFPKRRQISANAIGWLESEIQSWVEDRANGKPFNTDPPNPRRLNPKQRNAPPD